VDLIALRTSTPNRYVINARTFNRRIFVGYCYLDQGAEMNPGPWHCLLREDPDGERICVSDRFKDLDAMVECVAQLHLLVAGPHNFKVHVERYSGRLVT
jgi:hypothetical protein